MVILISYSHGASFVDAKGLEGAKLPKNRISIHIQSCDCLRSPRHRPHRGSACVESSALHHPGDQFRGYHLLSAKLPRYSEHRSKA